VSLPVPGSDLGAELGDLVKRARAGDPLAFRALYDRARPLVFRVARGFAALDGDEVDDVVQETFVRAFRSLDRLDRPDRFLPWILTTARNRALTRLTRRKTQVEVQDDLEQDVEALALAVDPPDDSREAELEVVRRVIEELPEGAEKETVQLFYVEGELSAREIAERLGVGKSTITMRLERFRAKVKRRIVAEVARLRGEESP
jgi:RNA polymerase sigma-70 factor (ECF subfamily)